ncbi:peptidyl-dipeptidase A [Reichenbachiella faecimaris]|uniref:Peptidyl-dipeptidase A n=1 Tax=Reichenbachiella faecimaris TaxID=692418 RepID=A0A1W2GR69_REIFA|nr:M2 family metallopeptidase [Reichenbachiella faecimaris]SMD39147.1 peptidyl-dipeptidase A [Reichenbachiella faecimaris]
MKKIAFLLLMATVGCKTNTETKVSQVDQFLNTYTERYLKLYAEYSEAEWEANTKIIDGDTLASHKVSQAGGAYAAFTGSAENIEQATKFLQDKEVLTAIQIKQLEAILYGAASNPGTVSDLVKEKIKADAAQNAALFGYDFQIDGESVSTNEIDEILKTSDNLDERLIAWNTSKEVGIGLKDGLENLVGLRNQTVQALEYEDYFTYQVSDYGMTRAEMLELCEQLVKDIWPLYRELHTYARYELASKYGQSVPDMLPAHWLPNRWGQSWSAMVEVEGIDLDAILEEKGSEWLVKQAEQFYVSMGFEPLPQSFYDKSSLYPLPEGADYKKNNHASAWHMDLQQDVRSLMSVTPNARWYETTHHELGHIYYYMEYTNPNVPPLLRGGANRAFHEGVGSQMGLAAMQKPFLEGLGLIEEGVETDEMQALLKEALDMVVVMPWGSGVMTQFENSLYAEALPRDLYNQKWWELKKKYQGIVPPSERGEEYCDAASKTHINNDPAQYYDYSLSTVILFQLHNHIAGNILKQDPRATNYYGSKKAGAFLRNILSKGATEDWRKLMKDNTGEEISAKAMLKYFEPLMGYLQQQNQGREHTLGEMPI